MIELPTDILWLLANCFEEEESVEFFSCCKDWYSFWVNRRKLCIRQWIYLNNDFVGKVKLLIGNPSEQLALNTRQSGYFPSVLNLLRAAHYSTFELVCNENQFSRIIRATEQLTVKQLFIFVMSIMLDEDFTKICNCEIFSLSCSLSSAALILPYLFSVKRLFLERINLLHSLETLATYASQLHHLSLNRCRISDVAMLGSIRSLELKSCYGFSDISPLNNNESVVIELCSSLVDYSRSFYNSRRIQIVVTEGPIWLNLTRWQKVEELTLKGPSHNFEIYYHYYHYKIPKTVKKCQLEGKFLYSMDFTVTTDHALQEISLINDDLIQSLEGYGFERLAAITVDNLRSLQSLTGIRAGGKTRKVTIRNCSEITDFSPLNHIPIVTIDNCKGFSGPLNYIPDLTIYPCQDIDFKPLLIPVQSTGVELLKQFYSGWSHSASILFDVRLPPPVEVITRSYRYYQNLQSLSLAYTHHLKSLEGVERIPVLQLKDKHGLTLIQACVENGHQFKNQRIILEDATGYLIYCRRELVAVHQQYMQDRYDTYDKLPKRWTWIVVIPDSLRLL